MNDRHNALLRERARAKARGDKLLLGIVDEDLAMNGWGSKPKTERAVASKRVSRRG